jgi:hypothetical protein
MIDARRETHTTVCCAHPYFGFVSTPNAIIDFSDRVPAEFRHEAFARIDRDGFRNRELPAHKPGDEFWIGLFGGSVAFGVPATSNESTIAGCLERRLNAGTRPRGKRVRVLNLAIPGGQQPQQLFVLLLNRQRLDGAITFDGVNEVVVPAFYNKDHIPSTFPFRPYYEVLYGKGISDDQICETVLAERRAASFERRPRWQRKLLGGLHARDMARRRAGLAAASAATTVEFRSFFGDSRDLPVLAIAQQGAQSWVDYTAVMSDVCHAQGVHALFAVQPIPDRGKVLTETERERLHLYADMLPIRIAGYERVISSATDLRRAGLPVSSFEDVFVAHAQSIYTDLIHFEDRGAEIVAERMSEWIARSWAGFSS